MTEATPAPEPTPAHEGWRYGEMIYNALYQHQGGLWRAVSDSDKESVWYPAGYRLAAALAAPTPPTKEDRT